MLREKALNVLALDNNATAVEIKEAYRDLVKVWHPDRFGNDPRLRQKAEDKLQQINDAYRVLQSPAKPDSTHGAAPRQRHTGSSANSNKAAVRSNKAAVRSNKDLVGWICGGLAIVVVFAVAAVALKYRWPRAQAPAIPEVHTQESTGVGSGPEFSPPKEQRAPVKDANLSHRQATTPFRVHELSDAEAAQLESACPREKMQDPTAYQECLRAQLDNSAPDLSTLSEDDRTGIESACRVTKSREGQSAYNRCLTRAVKLLKDSP